MTVRLGTESTASEAVGTQTPEPLHKRRHLHCTPGGDTQVYELLRCVALGMREERFDDPALIRFAIAQWPTTVR